MALASSWAGLKSPTPKWFASTPMKERSLLSYFRERTYKT